MLNRNQLRTIFVVLAAILLVISFMLGITGLTDNLGVIKESRSDYDSFKGSVDTLRENYAAQESGAEDYAIRKEAYDKRLADYEDKLSVLNDDESGFAEDVLDYNSKLVQYSAGKTAISAGQKALDDGKAQINKGWSGYEQGKAAYDAGVKEANEKLALYEQGKAAYELGLKEYEAGLEGFNQLMTAIQMMESSGVPHEQALAIISQQAGIQLSDEYIAATKTKLDTAKAELDSAKAQLDAGQEAIPGAEKQMKDAKDQLDAVYAQLSAGEKELNAAAKQLDAGKAELEKIKSDIDSGKGELASRSEALEAKKAELDAEKAELDAEKAELKVYENTRDKVSRRCEMLINDGYGKAGDDTDTIIAAADAHADKLHSEYKTQLLSFVVTYVCHLVAVLAAAVALIMVKKHFPAARVISIVTVGLGVAALIASIVCTAIDKVDTTAFAAAVFTAAGICLTDRTHTDLQ